MKESVLTGWGVGIEKLDAGDAEPGGITWKLDLVDATVGSDGHPIPGTGSGEILHVLLGDEAAGHLYQQLQAGGAGGIVPVTAGLAQLPLNRAQRRQRR